MLAVLFMTAGQVFGVIEYKDGGTHNINSLIPGDVWVDYQAPGMQTTVNVLDGGGILGPGGDHYWGKLEAYNDSRINISGGVVVYLDAWNFSTVNISGGHVSNLDSWNSSIVNMTGGEITEAVVIRDNSHVVISGGFFAGNLLALGTSSVVITGGNFRDDHATYLIASGSSTVDISGGYVNDLRPQETSTVTISGGRVDKLSVLGTSTTTFYGYEFTHENTLRFEGNKILSGNGWFSGKWRDGTQWTTSISEIPVGATILVISTITISPIADAGSNQTVEDTDDNGSEQVTLDGSGSSDNYGTIVSWVWTDSLGNTIPDGEVTTATLSVGTHTITLTVTDDDGLTDTDTVTVTIEPYPNQPPVANADGPYTIYVGDMLTLDASGSTDDDNNIVSYIWDLDDNNSFETDASSNAVFDVNYSYLQSLGLLVGNTYKIHLKVTDGGGLSNIANTTLTIIPTPALQVSVDIKPGSCPNPLNVKSSGVLPAAILGTADFDVTTIDPTSIRLAGVSPLRSSVEDVAGPAIDSNDCNCTEDGPDGFLDLTLKFKTRDIVEAIGDVNYGDTLILKLTGVLIGERPIEGADCVLIGGKSKPFNKADVNKDGVVDMQDFAIFAENWLQSSIVED